LVFLWISALTEIYDLMRFVVERRDSQSNTSF